MITSDILSGREINTLLTSLRHFPLIIDCYGISLLPSSFFTFADGEGIISRCTAGGGNEPFLPSLSVILLLYPIACYSLVIHCLALLLICLYFTEHTPHVEVIDVH